MKPVTNVVNTIPRVIYVNGRKAVEEFDLETSCNWFFYTGNRERVDPDDEHMALLPPQERAAKIERDEIQRQQARLEQYCDGYRMGG